MSNKTDSSKIGIIGYGIVGTAIDLTFSNKYDILKFDKFKSFNEFEDLIDCSFVFVSVPTPFNANLDEVDQFAVIESLNRLEELNYGGIVIIKSTLPVGSCSAYSLKYKLNIVSNPEFLRESTTPNEDFAEQDTVVIGNCNKKHFKSVKDLYDKVTVDHVEYFDLAFDEAEMIKYSQNTMLASRVALANMIYDACESMGLDYRKIREIAFDRFNILGPDMVQVPGPDGKRGFGGKCLPKDIYGFRSLFESDLVDEIIKYNESLRDDLGDLLNNFNKKK